MCRGPGGGASFRGVSRSGEGRGGEEGRFWGAPDHLKKKKKHNTNRICHLSITLSNNSLPAQWSDSGDVTQRVLPPIRTTHHHLLITSLNHNELYSHTTLH